MSLDESGLDLYIEDLDRHRPVADANEAERRWGNPNICCGFVGPCEKAGRWRRQNTQYHEAKQNWVYACDSCFEMIQEMWTERWREYYGMIR